MPCASTALPKPGQYLINLSLDLNTSRTNWGKRTCCVQPIMALPKTEIRSTIDSITKQSKPSYYSRFAAFPTVRPTLIKDAHCKTITNFFLGRILVLTNSITIVTICTIYKLMLAHLSILVYSESDTGIKHYIMQVSMCNM